MFLIVAIVNIQTTVGKGMASATSAVIRYNTGMGGILVVGKICAMTGVTGTTTVIATSAAIRHRGDPIRGMRIGRSEIFQCAIGSVAGYTGVMEHRIGTHRLTIGIHMATRSITARASKGHYKGGMIAARMAHKISAMTGVAGFTGDRFPFRRTAAFKGTVGGNVLMAEQTLVGGTDIIYVMDCGD
jgi:hypothetical protein